MRSSYLRNCARFAPLSILLLASANASATNVTEFPDNGSEQMGRGGAWVARASDPLAVAFNPAGLAGQRTALSLQANLTFHNSCFTRVKAQNDTTAEDVSAGGTYPKVCTDSGVFPNPQLAFNYRVNDRIGVGIAVLGPSGVGETQWPTFVNGAPAPNRYLLIEAKTQFLTPTIGIGAEIAEGFRIGGAFTWGFVKARFNNASLGQNGNNLSPRSNDIDATLIVSDYFVPGFRLGALYSPTRNLDVAAFYKWSDSIKASGDAYTRTNYYTPQVAAGNKSGVLDGDTTLSDCNAGAKAAGICSPGSAHVNIAVPMEARIGLRYHQPRQHPRPPAATPIEVPPQPGVDGVPVTASPPTAAMSAPPPVEPTPEHVRDPIAQDVFDVEADFTWANNSAFENLEIRFPGTAAGEGVIPVNGSPGQIPPNADVPHMYKDVLGVRVGGDVNILPDQFALRAGAYYETKAGDDRYQGLDFAAGARIGVAGGGTYRVKIRDHALDLMVGFMHVFVTDQTNNGPEGVTALAGTACNSTTAVAAGQPCPNGQRYRSLWPVNLGTITNSFNVINVGANYRF